MKKSLGHLPKEKRGELKKIVQLILSEVPETQFVVLYGSYARGDYTEYDQKTEFNIDTIFMSDFDILVLTPENSEHDSVIFRLERAAESFYKGYHYSMITPLQFVNESVEAFNRGIEEGRFFHRDIKKEGIILYNSGNYKIARMRKLNYIQILNLAQEYFNEKFDTANEFIKLANDSCNRGKYKMSSFLLHQATENFLHAIMLTATLYSPKEHNLTRLFNHTKKLTTKPLEVFPQDNKEEKRLFELLQDAYVQARYNPKFKVTKEDIFLLFQRVMEIKIITEEFCISQIEEHTCKIKL